MEEAIVSFAIERVSDLLIHEAFFLSGVREEVDCIKAELKRMQCFLKDADRKQEQDERLRNRVAEIRDLAYDAEDVIDTFILKVAHQGGFHGIIKRFTSIFTKPFHLHEIGMEVKTFQKKLEGISKSVPAYEISGEGEGSTSISLMQQRLRRTYSHVEEEDVVSLESMTRDVLAQLMTEEEDRLHVISIVGMGGIGKTTLARKVYKHNNVKRHFDCFAWAFISQNCMPREVLHDVLIKVHPPSKEERELSENQLIKKLSDVLKEKRYLVVLDDIWRIEHWNILKPAFPRGKKGSKILFTTRNKGVASEADPCNSPIELPPLNVDEGWRLFKKKAFPENTTESHARSREFEMLGREMVKKCGGLPLAIVVLGGLLATKKSPAQWEMVQRNIHAHLNKAQQQNQPYGAVNGILVLSYNDLPYYLKPCFLYLGHYPEDWEISKKELIRLWIAEGFISSSLEIGGRLMEDVAENFLEELINRCLVQVGQSDYTGVGVKTCRIHDLLRDLCVDKAREENFFEIFQPPLIENSAHSPDVILIESKQRRIAIHSSKRYVCLKGDHPKVRSLLHFQDESLVKLDISKYFNFKFLRVLKVVKRDVEEWHVSSEIGNLHHLRYLGLQCYFGKIILPRSIGKLKSLHTLRVNGRTKINFNVLFKLERLRHIFLYLNVKMCLGGRDILKNIETLKYITIEHLIENDAVLNFTNLRSLGLRFMRSKDVVLFLKALMRLHRLQSLDLRMNLSKEFLIPSYQDLEPLSQCHHLSKLRISAKILEDPHLRHHVLKFVPANIVKLTLVGSELKQDPMAVLEKLPHLRILWLMCNSYMGTKMICSANGFLQLDSLLIDNLRELEDWEIEEGAMPHLRSLDLESLSKLRMFPEGLRYLTSLQELKLQRMERSLVERIEVKDGREGEDFSKVSHIPSIQISNTPNRVSIYLRFSR